MSRCYLFIVLLFVSSVASAQVFSRQGADSLLATLRQPLNDSCRVNTLLDISGFLLHIRHISDDQLDSVSDQMTEVKRINQSLHKTTVDERLTLLQALFFKATDDKPAGKNLLWVLIHKLSREGNQHLLGGAYYELSDFYSSDLLQPTMSTRIYYLKESIKAYKKTQDQLSLGRDYRFLSDLHLMTDSLGMAFVEANNALLLYNAANYKDIQGILALLGRLYFSQQNYKDAISYELRALNTAKHSKQDNVRLICQINNCLGTFFLKVNDFKNSFNYYNAALDIAKKEKDNGTVYLLAANIVTAYLKAEQGLRAISFFQQINRSFPIPKRPIYEVGDYWVNKTFVKIYLALGRFDKAKPYADRVLEEIKNPNADANSLSEDYGLIAQINIGLHNFKIAKVYLKKNEKLLSAIKNYSDLSTNYRLMAALDTAQGDYHKGMKDILIAQQIEDSLFNATKFNQVEQLQVAYTTKEKESQIVALEQSSNAERINLQKANLMRDLSFGGTISLLIIAGLLYRQNRQKKEHNTTITRSNRKLGGLVAEKEWLLKEVHHRVKNNLHTVMCLLESQACFLADEALQAVENSRSRVYAMSLIHQKLYRPDNIQSIDIKSYISELMLFLTESLGYPERIRTYVDIAEVNLSIANAISVGLIINEAVNNAYKYAFPDGRKGEIAISLKLIDEEIRLEIRDNGVGIPFDPGKPVSNSLGIELMKGLATDLRGSIFFFDNGGTSIVVSFQYEKTANEFGDLLYAV